MKMTKEFYVYDTLFVMDTHQIMLISLFVHHLTTFTFIQLTDWVLPSS